MEVCTEKASAFLQYLNFISILVIKLSICMKQIKRRYEFCQLLATGIENKIMKTSFKSALPRTSHGKTKQTKKIAGHVKRLCSKTFNFKYSRKRFVPLKNNRFCF